MKISTLLFAVVALLACATAHAQTPPPRAAPARNSFVTLIGGMQTIDTSQTSSEFQLFGRTGTVETTRRKTSAPLVDLSFATKIHSRLGAGFGFVHTDVKQPVTFNARVPISADSIQIFPVSDTYPDAEHKETQLHFSVLWIAPFNDKVSIDFNGGPSVLLVDHDNIVAMTMPQLFFANPVITRESDTAIGYHAGFALRALLFQNAGLAVRIRYTQATAKLSTGEYTAGGLQIGAGLALVF